VTNREVAMQYKGEIGAVGHLARYIVADGRRTFNYGMLSSTTDPSSSWSGTFRPVSHRMWRVKLPSNHRQTLRGQQCFLRK